jgi:hypothetical protein
MKFFSLDHAYVVLLTFATGALTYGTQFFHPVVFLLIYGVLLANIRVKLLEEKK